MQGQTEGQRLGRWPANFIHDGSEEVVALFPDTKSGGGDKHGRKASTFCASTDWEAYKGTSNGGDSGSAARFFYCAKASKADRDEGCEKLQERSAGECVDRVEGSAGMESPRAGAGRTSGSRNHHPTVKPTDLMRYLCRLVTPPSGIVLDPFMGSGSTGKAAMLEGFAFVGIEREAEYVEIAKARIEAVKNLF
jgi:site-specific DNA-methyltransferase (adenine-specific)